MSGLDRSSNHGRYERIKARNDRASPGVPGRNRRPDLYRSARGGQAPALCLDSGPATKVLARRAFARFGDTRYARLAEISVSHLYNLRASVGYRKHRLVWQKTKPSPITIGVRKAPAPQGLPGYIRIDTVHQGDPDGVKGVYHINAVDIVTQWELVASVERISEVFLLPVIAFLLDGFPFVIRGFHSDSAAVNTAST